MSLSSSTDMFLLSNRVSGAGSATPSFSAVASDRDDLFTTQTHQRHADHPIRPTGADPGQMGFFALE